ncbi:MAG: hypothetical protein PHX83_07110 [Acidobacteriia bacterium]|nr:hypothetical protein [Terriglobia bacterium]
MTYNPCNGCKARRELAEVCDCVVSEQAERIAELEAELKEAREQRDARRDSLAQEIRGLLQARGYWVPSKERDACDLISAIGMALAAAEKRARAAEAEFVEIENALGVRKQLHNGAANAIAYAERDRKALREKVERLRQLLSTVHGHRDMLPVGLVESIETALAAKDDDRCAPSKKSS